MAMFSTRGRSTNAKQIRRKQQEEVKAASTRQWSDEQKAIFSHCETGEGNLVVRARAGTGKTTTIIEALKYLDGTILLCAFNKRIAQELESRVDGKAHVYTLHGLGFRFVRKAWPGVRVDDERGLRLAERALRMVGKPPTKDWKMAVDRLSSMVKEVAPFDAKKPDIIGALNTAYGCDEGLPNNYDREALIRATMEHLRLSAENDGTINFSDMLYVPLVNNQIYPCYDVVIVDEAQDMNRAQLDIALKVCRKSGKMIVIGDDRQAIYGFRGADSGSIDRLKKALNAHELGLKTTYRCPKSIVEKASAIVSDYRAHEQAPDGVIRNITPEKLAHELAPGDFVLSRTNAPLLSVVLDCVRIGKPAKIEGRDIGKGLIGIIRKLHPVDVEELSVLIHEWAATCIDRAGGNESRIQQIMDQADVIRVLSEDVEVRSIADLERKIESFFTDDENHSNRVVCSTVHKAKGLEADRVYLLTDTFKLNAFDGEESNINYVAITRAKKELVWVGSEFPVLGSAKRGKKHGVNPWNEDRLEEP